MKKLSLSVFFLFLLAFTIKAQVKNPKLHIEVLSSESQTLYTGFNNEIKIYCDGASQKNLMVSFSQGAYTKSLKSDSIYVLRLNNSNAPELIVSVSQNAKGKIKKTGEEKLTVMAMPKNVKFENGKIKDSKQKKTQ